jgi:hypothetical protein
MLDAQKVYHETLKHTRLEKDEYLTAYPYYRMIKGGCRILPPESTYSYLQKITFLTFITLLSVLTLAAFLSEKQHCKRPRQGYPSGELNKLGLWYHACRRNVGLLSVNT